MSMNVTSNPWLKGALFALAAGPGSFFPALYHASFARDRVHPRRHHKINYEKIALEGFETLLMAEKSVTFRVVFTPEERSN